jgi:hypothetical protein
VYVRQRTSFDLSSGNSLGDKYSVDLTALNAANGHLLIDNRLTFVGFRLDDPGEIYVEFRYWFHY